MLPQVLVFSCIPGIVEMSTLIVFKDGITSLTWMALRKTQCTSEAWSPVTSQEMPYIQGIASADHCTTARIPLSCKRSLAYKPSCAIGPPRMRRTRGSEGRRRLSD